MSRRSCRSLARSLVSGVATAMLLAVLVLTWPQSLGGEVAYVQVSGESMEPAFYSGDLMIVRQHDSYHRGDVIAYRIPKGDLGEGIIVVHRVIGGNARAGYRTQGDNRTVPDPWRPTQADVVGVLWTSVAGGARVIQGLRTPLGLAAIAGLLAAFAASAVLAPRRPAMRKARA